MTALLTPPPERAANTQEALSDAFERLFGLHRVQATEVLFVRHGQTAPARTERYSTPDPELSDLGREQSMLLATHLSETAVDAVYSSSMQSAAETAAYLAAPLGLPVTRVEGLRDVSYDPHVLSRLQRSSSLADALSERFLQTPRWDAMPGFEQSRTFRLRAIEAIDGIIAAQAGGPVVIVTHSAVINAYLSMILGIQRDLFFLPSHGSISRIRSSGDLYAVQQLNSVAHLPAALQSY